MKKVLITADVELDAFRIAIPGDVNMKIETEMETTQTTEIVYDLNEIIVTTAKGSIKFKALIDEDYSSDPVNVFDAFGLVGKFLEFDPDTETLSYSKSYGIFDEPSASYGVPQIPIESRQLEETGAIETEYDGTVEYFGMKFKAGADSLKLLRFLARNAVGDTTATINIGVYADDGDGLPDYAAGIVGQMLTVNFSIGADVGLNVYTGAALATGATYASATWQTISFETIDILDGANLIYGNTYHYVFRAISGQDSVYFNYSVNESNFPNAGLISGTALDVFSAVTGVPCFVSQSLPSKGGHNIKLRQRTKDGDMGLYYLLEACNVKIGAPSDGPKKSWELSIDFNSRNIIGPTRL